MHSSYIFFLFFFNDTAPTEIYTLSLHDALPISSLSCRSLRVGLRKSEPGAPVCRRSKLPVPGLPESFWSFGQRSEEHTSELQSQSNLVCRLLLEKKKKKKRLDQIRS